MLLQPIEKLNMELLEVREKAALTPLTIGELSDYSCMIAAMQLCFEAVEYLREKDVLAMEIEHDTEVSV